MFDTLFGRDPRKYQTYDLFVANQDINFIGNFGKARSSQPLPILQTSPAFAYPPQDIFKVLFIEIRVCDIDESIFDFIFIEIKISAYVLSGYKHMYMRASSCLWKIVCFGMLLALITLFCSYLNYFTESQYK